jgi:hypothetical protein
MTKKSKEKIQLLGSDTLDEGILSSPSSLPPAKNEIGEKVGELSEKIVRLEEKTRKIAAIEKEQADEKLKLSQLLAQINLSIKIGIWAGGIFASIVTIGLTFFGSYLLNEKQRIESNFNYIKSIIFCVSRDNCRKGQTKSLDI